MTNRIPDAELDVLATLNRLKQATARELRDAIDPFRPMAHGSVLTLLARLETKGLVLKERAPSGKAFLYRPTAKGLAAHRPLLRKIIDRMFGGSSARLVATLLETNPPTDEEAEEIRRLLDTARARRGGRKGPAK